MNANTIINDEMTLEQKLAAIDTAMSTQRADFNKTNGRPADTPVDPMDALMCEGCQ